ncbi:MAG: hypothetical protein P3A28_06995 [Gemmatimonadota bacterium]|nr:hypothetical protein [Gemmatimonadota bacterium]
MNYTSRVLGPSPFALPTPVSRFKSLATAVGRAPLGGPREAVMGTLLAARLAAGTLGPNPGATDLRASRAEGVRHWLGTVAIPQVPKAAIARLVELTVDGQPGSVAAALAKVTEVTAPYLDRAARSELESLASALRG